MKKLTILFSCALLAISCGENTTQQTESHETMPPVDTTALKTVSENALSDALSRGACRSHVMVMQTSTGQLLLNHCVELRGDSLTIVPAEDTTFEPGSLLAPVILATLLDNPALKIDTAMPVRVGYQTYPDASMRVMDYYKINSADSLPLHTAIVESSAVAACELGKKYYSDHPEKLAEQILRIFPSAKIHDIQTPGELYKICTGYDIILSPADILTFYSAVAAGGIEPVSGRRICSTSTASILNALLCEVVSTGPAKNIKTEAYPIAGKTALVSYFAEPIRHKSLFVGFFPADNPRFACLVTLDGLDFSTQPAKVFKTIADHLMNIDKES